MEISSVGNQSFTTFAEIKAALSTPSTIAIELNGKAYIPIHDLIEHIVLLNDLDGNIVEQYRYYAPLQN